jgi:hypothetical protein
MFLLSKGWTAAHGRLFTVPQSDALRIAFTPAAVHFSGGALQSDVVAVSGSGPRIRNLGPVQVRVSDEGSVADFYVSGRGKVAVPRVSVSGMLARPSHVVVTSRKAFCRQAEGQFLCRAALPPGGAVDLRVGHLGRRGARGKLTAAVGSAHTTFRIRLSR